MEESRRRPRLAKRLALAATIVCAGQVALDADDKDVEVNASPMRSMLSQGWQRSELQPLHRKLAPKRSVRVLTPHDDQPSILKAVPEVIVPEPIVIESQEIVPIDDAQVVESPKVQAAEPEQTPSREIEQKTSRDIEQKPSRGIEQTPSREITTIKRLPRVLVVDQPSQPARLPSAVGNVDVSAEDSFADVMKRNVDRPTRAAQDTHASWEKSRRWLESNDASEVAAPSAAPKVQRLTLQQRGDIRPLDDVKPVTATPQPRIPKAIGGALAADLGMIEDVAGDQAGPTLQEKTLAPKQSHVPTYAADPNVDIATSRPTSTLVMPEFASKPAAVNKREPVTMELPLANRVKAQPVSKPKPTRHALPAAGSTTEPGDVVTATIHATRQRELARQSLYSAHQRYQRGAYHSARKMTLQSLRGIVAMHDALSSSSVHGQKLDAALNAIRESEDFAGRFGPVNNAALKRMVAVHETDALQGVDLSKLAPLRATELYLAQARKDLVIASGGSREASDALVMLGKVEQKIAGDSDAHAAAVALTLHRAAVEVAPDNATALQELGSSLLNQGLIESAIKMLKQSVTVRPTPRAYHQLLDASLRIDDIEGAKSCVEALAKLKQESVIPVNQMAPEQFAKTHQPTKVHKPAIQPKQTRLPVTEKQKLKKKPNALISKAKSWLSFGR